MFGLDPVILFAILVVPTSIISFEMFRGSRSLRRNREDRCGNCGGPLYAPGSFAGPSILEGHLICEPCATTARRSVKRSLLAAGGITTLTLLALGGVAIWAPSQLGSHPWIPVVATALEYPVLFLGAIALMTRANRRAEQRLGLRPQPALEAFSGSGLASMSEIQRLEAACDSAVGQADGSSPTVRTTR